MGRETKVSPTTPSFFIRILFTLFDLLYYKQYKDRPPRTT